MNILHVIESLGRGGAEQQLVTMLPELARQGHSVAVAVRGGSMDLAPQLEALGVRVIRLPSHHRWNLIGGAQHIARAWRDADIIHAHLYFPAVCTALARTLGLTSARTCVTFHNMAYAGANARGIRLALRRRLAAALYPLGIDRCLAVSAAVAAHYSNALELRDIRVLPNPIDMAALRPRPALRRAHPVIALPGRLVHEKGHADALAALACLGRSGSHPQLEVLGDGPLRCTLESLARALGLKSRVRFLGALPHARMLDRMAAADLVLIPSRFEGFGLTALEAMALGRPVIATTAGGLPETVGPAGILVPPGDIDALAAAISALLADPGRCAALGAAGTQRARGRFDLPHIAGDLAAHYRALGAAGVQPSGCLQNA